MTYSTATKEIYFFIEKIGESPYIQAYMVGSAVISQLIMS
jgi:hypothetical protein